MILACGWQYYATHNILIAWTSWVFLPGSKDRGAWRAIAHGVTNSWTRLRWLSIHTCMSENRLFFFFLIFIVIYLAVLGLCCSIRRLGCGMWNLVPWIWIKLGPPALVLQSLGHWTPREVPKQTFILNFLMYFLIGGNLLSNVVLVSRAGGIRLPGH